MTTIETPSIDDLWAMVQQQEALAREQQAALQERVIQLESQLEQQRLDKLALSSRVREIEEGEGHERPRVSRAGLLKAAVVGVAGLAGAEALSPHAAAAAGTDGDVGLGVANTTGTNTSANNQTTILAASGMAGTAVLRVDAFNGGANAGNIDGVSGVGSGAFSGVSGYGGANRGPGMYGAGGPWGTGVIGVSGETPRPAPTSITAGVYGIATFEVGVQGESKYSAGVLGYSQLSIGVRAVSGSDIDLAAIGTGRLYVNPQATAGAPATGGYNRGELIVDRTGVPYACTVGGVPGTWQAVGNLRSFPAPHRVFGDGGVISAGTTTAAIDATVAGVPAGATSAYCAVQATAAGVMTLFPDGAPDPGIANWANTGNSGQLALFYMLVPLSAAGKFQIHSYLTGQIYVDVWGYLL